MTDQPPRKFRVWDGETMHEPPHGYVLVDDGRVHHESDGSLDPFRDVEPLFSTGLSDAEGNEVWEGGLLRYKGEIGVVEYREDAFFWIRQGQRPISLGVVCEFGGVVIGNHYENPELNEEVIA